ncbi:hypothetical protein O1611_g4550 [Lasiodiplodia mahajangana]|uniref:Uncharacterized protein n=1 Tax=Lasiodiplodia mahajangana TaxID=1108764 RepID=A0ACC2JNZ4_9PEZI|nr:hypothetical protein O1611_g4550 [Lasiodiplodia mahajangana]
MDPSQAIDALAKVLPSEQLVIRGSPEYKGTKVDYVYMNYASEDQDVIKSYGGENKKFLQETSKKYDPEGLFQKGVPGGWKLFT